jgi:DNA repair protein RAD5
MLKALEVTQSVLAPLVLRRTKDTKDKNGTVVFANSVNRVGDPILVLPEKVVKTEYIDFSEDEQAVYNYISDRARRTFKANLAAGTVFKNYTTILTLLLRLRQCCCHVSLVKVKDQTLDELDGAGDDLGNDINLDSMIEKFKNLKGEDKQDVTTNYGLHVMEQILQDAEQECPICAIEPMQKEAVSLPCFHMACKMCIIQHIKVVTEPFYKQLT